MAALRYRFAFAGRGLPIMAALVITIFFWGLALDSRGEEEPHLHPEVQSALGWYRLAPEVLSKYTVELELRSVILRLVNRGEGDLLAAQRDILVGMAAPAEFMEFYDSAADWARGLENDNGFRAYYQHRIFAAGEHEETFTFVTETNTWRPMDKTERVAARKLALQLSYFALKKRFPPALFDDSARDFAAGNGTLACMQLAELAIKGHPKAAQELGRRFASGDGLPQSDFQALYWLTVAGHIGPEKEVEEKLKELLARSTPKTQDYAARWLKRSGMGVDDARVPPCWITQIP